MNKKTRSEMNWSKVRKAAVSAIRLKHSLLADEELNDVLPQLEMDYQKALLSGVAYELDTASLMAGLDAD